MKKIIFNFRHILAFFISGIIIFSVILYIYLFTAPKYFPEQYITKIEEGRTLSQISSQLLNEKIIKNSFFFKVIVKLSGKNTGVLSGSYYFFRASNVFAVSGRLIRGDHGVEPLKITISEGLENYKIAKFLEKEIPNFNLQKFLEKAKDKEGYLFPDTYLFLPDTDEQSVIDKMNKNFNEKIKTISSDIKKSNRSLNEIIIMASILEKEAQKTDDRKKIAGILWKRLDAGMALQVDSTLTYVVGRSTYNLTKDDLSFNSPYNTYKYKGLPEGPIANPGLDAILSAIYYDKNPYWFYLADKNGNTYYSKTFNEHIKNKRKYIN